MNLQWRLTCAGLFFTIGFLGGCGSNGNVVQHGNLCGKVTLKGQPVTGGKLIFLTEDDKTIEVSIQPDGTYSGGVPLGEARVAVDTEFIKAMVSATQHTVSGSARNFNREANREAFGKIDGKDFKPPKPEERSKFNSMQGMKYVPIPEKYRKPKESGISVTVSRGSQEKDFNLP
jgi:hypothetical protein